MKITENGIQLKAGVTYIVPIKNGYLDIRVSADEDYPGVDIEYMTEENNKNDTPETRPRVVIEHNKDTDELRTLIWANKASEDYSESVTFTKE